MNRHNQSLPTSREVVSSIYRSEEHQQIRGETGGRATSLGTLALAAERLADSAAEKNRGYETPESLQLRLIQRLPDWLKAQYNLDTQRSEMSRADRRSAVGATVEFNHVLREIIDNEVYTEMSEVMSFVSDTLLSLRVGGSTVKYANQSLRGVLDGMRHEIASESVLASLPGVEDVRGAETIEEEMHGKDIIVIYRGSEIALDIKSTKRSADEANARNRHPDYIAIWSGFTWDDFGGRLLPDMVQIRQKAAYFTNELNRLAPSKRNRSALSEIGSIAN